MLDTVFDYEDSFKMYTFNTGVQNYLYTVLYTMYKNEKIIIKRITTLPKYYTILEKINKKAIFYINNKKIEYNIDYGYLIQQGNKFLIYDIGGINE